MVLSVRTTVAVLSAVLVTALQAGSLDSFAADIRPVLVEHCGACHLNGSPGIRQFLEARSAGQVAARSGVWRSVAMQLRNRTMPPFPAPGPSDDERNGIAGWIDGTLRSRACDAGPYAGPVTVRRLNRREYENTVSDLFGLRLDVAELFPVDGSGGEGFDNNGETLFLSPLLAERYLEVADRVLEHVIVAPPLVRAFVAKDLLPDRPVDGHDSVPVRPGELVETRIAFRNSGSYSISAVILTPEPDTRPELELLVDGQRTSSLRFSWGAAEAAGSRTQVEVSSGEHRVSLRLTEESPAIRLVTFDLAERPREVSAARRAAHFRLFGREPATTVLDPRREAAGLLRRFVRSAFRRPLKDGETEPFLDLFDRSTRRGDPFEEGVRIALKAVLVSPDFLYRVEAAPAGPDPERLSAHELATRLSYFLWGTMPDSELLHLADGGLLLDDAVLAGQVDRLVDDPRSRFFAEHFIGQWLGTKDVGGRVAPTLNEIQHFYTPRIAADMREEPILVFQRLLAEDRSLLEFIAADYTYLTERLAQFIGMPGVVRGNRFQLVSIPDGRRGGLLGLAAVQAMNAEYRRSSPILRGVWILETLLGTKVPPPPPDTPAIKAEDAGPGGVTNRQVVESHRGAPACASCHNVIDPLGFGLEHYDWLGRWRDVDAHGNAIDAAAILPSGETLSGLQGLQAHLLSRQDEVLRQVVRKLLGFALGRSLLDRDSCVVETILGALGDASFGARTLVREVVLSVPFRTVQREVRRQSADPGAARVAIQ